MSIRLGWTQPPHPGVGASHTTPNTANVMSTTSIPSDITVAAAGITARAGIRSRGGDVCREHCDASATLCPTELTNIAFDAPLPHGSL